MIDENKLTYIILSRSLIDSEVFADPILLKIWIWCLIKANHDSNYKSIKIGKGFESINLDRGSFLFGRNTASEALCIPPSTVYKKIKKLEDIGNISLDSNSHYSIVTICNYGYYQDFDTYKRHSGTGKEQPSSNQVAAKEQHQNNTVAAPEQHRSTDNTPNTPNAINADKPPKKPKKTIQEREHSFIESATKVNNDKSIMDDVMVECFCNYWTEPDQQQKKMRFEQQKTWDTARRMKTWFNNNFNSQPSFGFNGNNDQQPAKRVIADD